MQNTSTSVIYTNIDKDGNALTRSRTVKVPLAFVNKDDAEWLMKLGMATKETMNHVLHVIRDKFFTPLTITVDGNDKVITLFDLFNKKGGIKGPFIYDGKTVNKSINTYPIREILNDKCPLIGTCTDDIVKFFSSQLPDGANVKITFVKESVYARIQGNIINAVTKKLNQDKGNTKKDKTWRTCCRNAAETHTKTDAEAKKLSTQMELLGVQIQEMNNGGVPSVDKWPKKCKVDKPEINQNFISAYKDALTLFKKEFTEAFPEIKRQALLSCPSLILDWDKRDVSKFYDVPGKLANLPGLGKRTAVKVRIRTVSGHSDTYYPKELQSMLKAVPVIGIRFPENVTPEEIISEDGARATKCNILGHIAANLPYVETEFNPDGVNSDDGVGIDINVASFFMNTTVKMSDTEGAVDWPEAINEFRSQNPTAYPFTMPYTRSVKELNELADSVKENGRLLRIIPLVGLRDGKPADAKHGWTASPDPLSTLFNWMNHRTDTNGNPFYSVEQLAHIAHTRDFRKLVRSETANRLHYFSEQSKWDLTHDGQKNPFACTETAMELLAERSDIQNRIEKEFSRLVVTGLFSSVKTGRIAYVKMEDVDLSELKGRNPAKSLYTTARDEWGMCDGKLSCKNGKIEFTTECDYEFSAAKSTEYWKVVSVSREANIVTVNAEPTAKWVEETARHWIDSYTHRALHFSSVKDIVKELCVKRSIHFALVNPSHTSQICHVCRSATHINFKGSNTENLGKEACLTRHVNFRKGRTFVCGNPDCDMCGKVQNADDNAAWNVLLPEIYIKNKRVKAKAA